MITVSHNGAATTFRKKHVEPYRNNLKHLGRAKTLFLFVQEIIGATASPMSKAVRFVQQMNIAVTQALALRVMNVVPI